MVENDKPPQEAAKSTDLGDDDAERTQGLGPGGLAPTRNAAADSSRGIVGNADHVELTESFGRYRILRTLGAGAMGVVYLARDTQLDRDVALKIPRFVDQSHVVIDRFYREARSMATLHHPNLCSIYDVGEIEGVHFLAMAYIAGHSLSEVLQDGKHLGSQNIAGLIQKLAIALEEAHQAGVIHRDLKPANVMIDQRGEPVIMDFGLAHRDGVEESQLTQVGTVIGTPAYMSPEQVEGHLIGPASDTYSLGVIMFQMLCSRLPFEGSSAAVMGKILVMQPPRPSSFSAGVDADLESICMRAISKRPDERFETAAELAAELNNYLSDTDKETSGPRLLTQSAAALDGKSVRFRRHRSPISSVAFSHSGRFALSTSGDGQICLWDLTQRTFVRRFDGHQHQVHSATFSKTGARAVSCGEDQTLRLWDVAGGREIGRFKKHQGISHQARFVGKNDRWIVTAGPDAMVCVWDSTNGEVQRQFAGHRGFVMDVAVSLDGTRIVSASNDRRVRLWDVKTGNEVPGEMSHQGPVNSVVFSPDGRWILSASDDATIRVWNARTGRETRRFEETGRAVVSMVLSRDGSKVLSGSKDGLVVLWDFDTGTRVLLLDGHRNGVNCVALSANGKKCLSGGVENDVVLWTP